MADITLQISANARKATQSINNLNNAMRRLATSVNSVNTQRLSTGFSTLGQSLASTNSNIASTNSNLQKTNSSSATLVSGVGRLTAGFSKLKISTNSLASAFGMFYAKYFLIIRAVKLLWSSVKNASSVVENFNYFNKTYQQIAKNSVDNWSELGEEAGQAYAQSFVTEATKITETLSGYSVSSTGSITSTGNKSLGLSATSLMNYQSQFAQLANSMGVASDLSTKLTEVYTKLGADLSSMKNMNTTTVWDNLSSGMVGMSRAVDKYGSNIRIANMNQELTTMGISKTVSQLSAQDKVLLRSIIILKSTQQGWGDYAQTIDTVANQTRLLKTQFSNLGIAIGQIFLSGLQKILPYINGLVIALQRLAQWIISTLGIKLPTVSSSTSSSISDLNDAIYGTDDALSSASDSADKLKKNLLGIDELNTISTDDGSSGSGTSGITTNDAQIAEAFNKLYEEYNKVWQDAYDNMTNKSQEIANSIVDMFKKGNYNDIGTYVSKGVANALSKIDWDATYSKMHKAGNSMGEFINGIFDIDSWGTFGTSLAGWINSTWNYLHGLVLSLDWNKIGKALANGINKFTEEIDAKKIAETIYYAIKGAAELVVTLCKKTDWIKVGQKIGDFISELNIPDLVVSIGEALLNVAGALLITTATATVTVLKNAFTLSDETFDKLKLTDLAGSSIDPSLATEFDDETGEIKITTPYSWMLELKDVSTNNSSVEKAEISEEKALELKTNAVEASKNAYSAYAQEQASVAEASKQVQSAITSESLATNRATSALEDVTSTMNSLGITSSDLSNYVDVLANADIANLTQKVQDLTDLFAEEMPNAVATVKDGMKEIRTSFVGLYNYLNNVFFNLFTEKKLETALGDVVTAFDTVFTNVGKTIQTIMNKLIDAINETMKVTWDAVSIGGTEAVAKGSAQIISLNHIQAFATGGYPTSGELFIANENGAEMVGSIGGRTAVANNDQIVSAISQGVYQAVTSAMGSGSNVNVTLEGDARGLFKVVKKQNDMFRKTTGVSAFV